MTSANLRSSLRRVLEMIHPSLARRIVEWRTARAHDRAYAQSEIEAWRERIADVLACPDNARLPRVRDAGRIRGGFQVMFNGLRVERTGYYGPGMTELLRRNRGSHEPQEEIVFSDVLRRLPPGSCMVECGAYWGFYSMWFARDVPRGRVWLIEPEPLNMEVGRRNFAANGLSGHFTRALVGASSATGEPAQVSLDDFLAAQGIAHLDILHADIQGAEVAMLDGAVRTLARHAVDYWFISTHSAAIHAVCVSKLAAAGYETAVSIAPEQSYSFDGVIVAYREGLLTSPLVAPSEKMRRGDQF